MSTHVDDPTTGVGTLGGEVDFDKKRVTERFVVLVFG